MAQLAEKEHRRQTLYVFSPGGYWVLPNSIVCYWVCAVVWGLIFTTGLTIMWCMWIDVLECGQRIQVCRDLKIERFAVHLRLTNVSVHFRMTKLKGFIR